MSELNRVVIDTQVFLRALINRDSSAGKLMYRWSAYYNLLMSQAIENEIHDVINRPKIRKKFAQITDEKAEELITDIRRKALYVIVNPEDIEPICRDPKDDIFLACAKIAQADYLVSEDLDLLVLKQHHSTHIVNVAAFLTALEAQA